MGFRKMDKELMKVDNEVIKRLIHRVREVQVMVDSDLATLYGVSTKRLNEQVRRNISRFPKNFMFKLSVNEKEQLVANCDRFRTLKHSTVMPSVFTEQGVAMLSGVLKSEIAIKVSIQIMEAFVAMRRFISKNAELFVRLDRVERKQIDYDEKFEKVFDAIENKEVKQGIFFNGQIFDAYKFVSDLVRSAKRSIVLVDNYVDDSVLTLFSKREKDVKVVIYTKTITKQLKLDLAKYNSQYNSISVKEFKDAHDRFMIIDGEEVYHIGASLKDLGKKWFAFSKFDKEALGLLEGLG